VSYIDAVEVVFIYAAGGCR